jgi:HEAT repeat protein
MPFLTRPRRVRPAALTVAVLLVTAGRAWLGADVRQVSVESLLYDLKHPDAVRRQAAVKELGATRYRPAIPALVALANDPAAPVRRELEFALESMDDMAALPGFIALASDTESDIRFRAVASLVNVHVPHAIGVTLASLRERIPFGSNEDLYTLVEPDVAIDPVVVETLRARTGDPERGIRRTAVRGLGILRARSAVPDLLPIAREDRDDGLRFEAVRALRKIGDASVGGELLALLNVNGDAVRDELIATLGSLRYRPAVPELTRIVVQSRKVDDACVLAMSALADLADASSAPLFERFKADTHEKMRLFANEGIARIAEARMQTDISAARLVEKSARVRTAQAFALLRLGQAEYLDELVRALEHAATRDLAKEYLLETRPSDRTALFAPRPASAAARVELADVLGLMGDPHALPVLQELAHDADKDVARAAERAARRIAVANSSQ